MITLEGFDPGDPRLAVCGARSPGGRMGCKHPPDHRFDDGGYAENHCGRDQRGQWRSWAMKDAREDQILTLRQQELTLDAIAAAVGISQPRICQIFAEVRKRRPDLTFTPPETLTTAEAAKILGLSTGHVAGLARDGRIAATQFAGRWHIDATAVTAYAEAHPDVCARPTEEDALMPGKNPTLKNTLISAAYDALDDDRYITCAAMCQLIEQLQTDEALTTPAPWDAAPRYRRGLMSLDGDLVREAREARGKPIVRLDAPADEDHPGDCMCYRCMDEAQENEDES